MFSAFPCEGTLGGSPVPFCARDFVSQPPEDKRGVQDPNMRVGPAPPAVEEKPHTYELRSTNEMWVVRGRIEAGEEEFRHTITAIPRTGGRC